MAASKDDISGNDYKPPPRQTVNEVTLTCDVNHNFTVIQSNCSIKINITRYYYYRVSTVFLKPRVLYYDQIFKRSLHDYNNCQVTTCQISNKLQPCGKNTQSTSTTKPN